MLKSTARCIKQPKQPAQHPVLRLLPRLPAPSPKCQAVADGLTRLKNEALHGIHLGALILTVQPDGNYHWEAFGSLSNSRNALAVASSKLTAAVYKECFDMD